MNVSNDLTEPVVSTCPACGLPVTTYWMQDNTGCVSRPEYTLVADWVYHAHCWDDLGTMSKGALTWKS